MTWGVWFLVIVYLRIAVLALVEYLDSTKIMLVVRRGLKQCKFSGRAVPELRIRSIMFGLLD